MIDKIEILSVDLLDSQRITVDDLKRLAHSLGIEFGWHYLLDLTWILANLGTIRSKQIMDAGAGTGLLQWYLAESGAEVFSVDRGSRADLPLRFRRRFKVNGLRRQPDPDLNSVVKVLAASLKKPKKAIIQSKELYKMVSAQPVSGRVIIYNQDLRELPGIATNSLDAVVAVSALEHNNPEDLKSVVAELMRTLRPGGMLLATLCAARDQDWYHRHSAGWCYTDSSLRQLFDLSDRASSNYADYDALFTALKNCAELEQNLASFYFASGENGMPWGKWDPQYQPVGVCKIKP